MKTRKILFIDTTHPLLPDTLRQWGFQCDHFTEYTYDDFCSIAGEYTGVVIRSRIKIDKHFLEKAKHLKFIARVGAGMENIDVNSASAKGVVCLNAPEGNRDAVGEQAVGMLLALFNNLIKADSEVRKGQWNREENRGFEIGEKTIGIIGYGNTGGAFARKLKGFGAEVIAYDKYKNGFSDDFVRECDMNELFANADVVSFHVPLAEETTFLANGQFFNRFSKPFYLINTARGKVVNTNDLVRSLESGKVLGACLDVLEYEGFSYEDLRSGSLPEAFSKLVNMPNVILSPHIAGWTHESNERLAKVILDKIAALKLEKK